MADECKECRKWEEEMYWTRFHSVQFCQILSGDFHQQLAIPQKFVDNLRDKLGGTADLKGPSGAIWNVELVSTEGTLFFKAGWKEFLDDHSLEENDILIFKYYNGVGRFDVLIFEKGSLCEKEASYFVHKCLHSEVEIGRNTMVNTPPESDESSHDVADCSPAKRPRKMANRTTSSKCPTRANAKGRQGNNGKRSPSNNTSAHVMHPTPNRRLVTEEEKQKALQLANAASSENSFTVVMRPSHVYKRFYMSVPSGWAKAHLTHKHQDIILRVKDKTWLVKFYISSRSVGFACGWKNFSLENFLEEFDVCLFSLASYSPGPVVFDVSIFRVFQDVVPP